MCHISGDFRYKADKANQWSLVKFVSRRLFLATQTNPEMQHQTKCQEFVRQPKCLLLQPDLDYLAPEIWRHSKCSHKSDIFSLALVMGQTYDLCRHKSPISCHLLGASYEQQLKKVSIVWASRLGDFFRSPFLACH